MIDINEIQFPNPTNVIDLETGLRDLRNKYLRDHVDSFNPIRYNLLNDQQKEELAAYRLALLAVPQQAGWPNNVEWPTKPSWL